MRPKFDVEPLSEARWSRIERSVISEAMLVTPEVAAPRRSERPTRLRAASTFVLAGAAAAVIGGLAVRTFLMPPEHVAVPSRTITDATGSHVRVGGSELDIRPRSAVVVSGDDAQGVLVVVDRGEVECEVAPRKERPPFTVVAGDVRVVVVGTHFIVRRSGDSAVVVVQRGTVDVTSPGHHVLLHPGEQWPAASAEPATTAPAPIAVPLPPAPTASSDVTPPSIAKAQAPPVAPSAAPATPRDRYQSAMKLEAREPDRAIAIYRELARSGGAWGMNALFAEARLEADRGNRAEARRLLDDYLARYPGGPNADDARRLLERLR